jgi:hypothetical protein
MEIVEIVTFHLNNLEEILEVSFRTNLDSEDIVREGEIPYIEISDFGYNFHDENGLNLFEDVDDYFDEFGDDDLFVDETEIISFLNEYYVLFHDKLPKAELF